jgi:hypothetical protein
MASKGMWHSLATSSSASSTSPASFATLLTLRSCFLAFFFFFQVSTANRPFLSVDLSDFWGIALSIEEFDLPASLLQKISHQCLKIKMTMGTIETSRKIDALHRENPNHRFDMLPKFTHLAQIDMDDVIHPLLVREVLRDVCTASVETILKLSLACSPAWDYFDPQLEYTFQQRVDESIPHLAQFSRLTVRLNLGFFSPCD